MIPTVEIAEVIYYVANFISIIIICSCVYMKIPQIQQLRESESTRGISTTAVLMETLGYTFISAYNFYQGYSILTFMEYPVILIQLYVLLFYILKYKKLLNDPKLLVPIVIYFAFATGLLLRSVPEIIIPYLVPMSTPLSGFSKIAYIYAIFKARNSDSVSLLTWTISAGTNIGRIFTVLMDSGDWKLTLNLMVSAILSASVLLTAFFYRFPKLRLRKRFPRYWHVE